LRGLTYRFFVARKVKELAKRVNIDIVDFPNYGGYGFFYALSHSLPTIIRLVTPLALDIRSKQIPISARDSILLWLEKETVRRATHLTSPSKANADICSQIYGVPQNRITVVPLGIPLPILRNADQPDVSRMKRVLYVGRLDRRKGIDTLFAAIPTVLHRCPETQFMVVGPDTGEAPGSLSYQEYAHRVFSTEELVYIIFAGAVARSKLYEYYRQADVVVAPSRYESFGLVYLEAMAHGKPVVACNVGGVGEVVSHDCGILVPPDEPDYLANAILTLLDDDERRIQMGKRGRLRVESDFTQEKMAYRMLEVYRRFVA
jgi:glycosyltransferase involved in cell wall biosynthesis